MHYVFFEEYGHLDFKYKHGRAESALNVIAHLEDKEEIRSLIYTVS